MKGDPETGSVPVLSKALPGVAVADTAIPESYVWPQRLTATVAYDDFGNDEIPVIDLACFNAEESHAAHAAHTSESESRRQQQQHQALTRLHETCSRWGFFQVVNHGVDVELLDRIQAMSLKFFDLPLETKERLECQLNGDRMLGYGFLISTKTRTSRRPWSEGLFVDPTSAPGFASVLWPEDGDSQREFCKAIEDYFGALRYLSLKIARLILNSLGMYPDKYDGFVPKEPALMRLNHYPPCPDPSQAVGLLPHTDANLFTILHQGDVAGLQVLNDDRWVAVRPHPHAFAINVGDMLQAISNGRYTSAPHKGVVNKVQDRYSAAYFVQAPDWDQIVPFPELVDSEHPKKYRPFTWTEYLRAQILKPLVALQDFTVECNNRPPS